MGLSLCVYVWPGYADVLAATGEGALLRSLGPADRADVLMACAMPPPTAVALLLRTLPFLDPARLRRLCQYALCPPLTC